MHETMRQTLEAFQLEFRDRVTALDASEYVPAGNDDDMPSVDLSEG